MSLVSYILCGYTLRRTEGTDDYESGVVEDDDDLGVGAKSVLENKTLGE